MPGELGGSAGSSSGTAGNSMSRAGTSTGSGSGGGAGTSGNGGSSGSSSSGGSQQGGSTQGGSSGKGGTPSTQGGSSGSGGVMPGMGGSAGNVACADGGASDATNEDAAPPPSGSNVVLRWYEDGQLLGEQSGTTLFIFQTGEVGFNAFASSAELPVNNVYYQTMRLRFDYASALVPGTYSCDSGIGAKPTTPVGTPFVTLAVLDSVYASPTPDSWLPSDFIPYPWDLLDTHEACETDEEGFSSTAWVRVDAAGDTISGEFELTVTSDMPELACRTLRVHGVLADVPVAECELSQDCNELLGHDLGIRAE